MSDGKCSVRRPMFNVVQCLKSKRAKWQLVARPNPRVMICAVEAEVNGCTIDA